MDRHIAKTSIRLWSVDQGTTLPAGHSRWVRAVVFSPDGQILSGSEDHTIRLWEIRTGICRQTLQGHIG